MKKILLLTWIFFVYSLSASSIASKRSVISSSVLSVEIVAEMLNIKASADVVPYVLNLKATRFMTDNYFSDIIAD
jgi:hypothetical protein